MRTIMLVTLGALLASVLAAAQTSSDLLEGTWAGEVACLHGGGDAVVISIARDASGRFTGASDWGLARSDGRKGPQVPFTRLTVNGRSVAGMGNPSSSMRASVAMSDERPLNPAAHVTRAMAWR